MLVQRRVRDTAQRRVRDPALRVCITESIVSDDALLVQSRVRDPALRNRFPPLLCSETWYIFILEWHRLVLPTLLPDDEYLPVPLTEMFVLLFILLILYILFGFGLSGLGINKA
jgi:hypothetical protein